MLKQIIIIRKDLNMRKGKMCAQAAHASMAVFTNQIHENLYEYNMYLDKSVARDLKAIEWFKNSFTKIVVGVNSESELHEIYSKAKEKGMLCSLIQDSGKTEFNGIPTYTAVAIGPDEEEVIDQLTGYLKLL